MRIIILSIAGIIVFGGFAYFAMRTTPPPLQESTVGAKVVADIPSLLRGTIMQISNGNTTVDVELDTFASGDTVVLGGASKEGEETVTVFIPEFSDTFKEGAWGVLTDTYVVVPTYINFGGTGQFFMLALFSYNDETKKFTHRDLHFVNDRIAYDGMVQIASDTIRLNYRTHAEGVAMTDEPILAASRTLRIKNNKLELLE